MSYHFSMGAINKHTNNYEYPKIADKKYKYKCPCCEKDVIFKNGKVVDRIVGALPKAELEAAIKPHI